MEAAEDKLFKCDAVSAHLKTWSSHTCQHSCRLRESLAFFTLEQPPASNDQIAENLPQFTLLSLKGFLICNTMGILMFLIMHVVQIDSPHGKYNFVMSYRIKTTRIRVIIDLSN